MSNVYDIFRSVQDKRKTCYDNRSAAFILEGKLSQDIIHKRLNKTIKSALVFDSKEGPDEVIVYSLLDDDLLKADYFVFDNVNYLVYENIKLTDKDVNYKKQKAVECNVTFTHNSETHIGYFMSTLRRTNDPDFKREGFIPNENPLIILPSTTSIEIGEYFNIEGKPWKVVENDYITNKGITYFYLERGYKENIPEVEPIVQMQSFSIEMPTLKPMIEYNFDTEEGFFSSTPKVELIRRSLNSVSFKIPFGISEVSISIKESGQIVETTYKVVM